MHDFVLDISSGCTVYAEDFLKHKILSLRILLYWTLHVTVPLASAGNYNPDQLLHTKCNYPYHGPTTNHATLRSGRQFKHI